MLTKDGVLTPKTITRDEIAFMSRSQRRRIANLVKAPIIKGTQKPYTKPVTAGRSLDNK